MAKHKYGAIRTEVDGYTFASKAEAKRYGELKLLEKAGLIRGLVLQPKYALHAGTSEELSLVGHYVADFTYLDARNAQIVEDVKSPATKTAIYRWKIKHLRAQYGIEITEVMSGRR